MNLDALQFLAAPTNICMVHRLAFRRLIGRNPRPADCMVYFSAQAPAFGAAAMAKIIRQDLAPGRNFHLNSRDIARQLIAWRHENCRDSGEEKKAAAIRKTTVKHPCFTTSYEG